MRDLADAAASGLHMLCSAPTGTGKTAAALYPMLERALAVLLAPPAPERDTQIARDVYAATPRSELRCVWSGAKLDRGFCGTAQLGHDAGRILVSAAHDEPARALRHETEANQENQCR